MLFNYLIIRMSINEIINNNRNFWNDRISQIYKYIEQSLDRFINKIKNGILIDLSAKKITIDTKSRCCIICFGGYAYESYKKIFEIDKTISINSPTTCDYDISISLKDDLTEEDEKILQQSMEKILIESFNNINYVDETLTECKNENEYKRYKNNTNENGGFICVINKIFILTKMSTRKYISYRILVVCNDNLIHIIEIYLRRYNYINDFMTFRDIQDLKLVKIIDSNKNIHLTVDCDTLIKTNMISLKNRLHKFLYEKAWQDYKRMICLIDLIDNNKSSIKIVKDTCIWLNNSNMIYNKKKLNKYPFILLNKYIENREFIKETIEEFTSIMKIVCDNDIKTKLNLKCYYMFTSGDAEKKVIEKHFKLFYDENI